jgi:aspartyl-tRNA(Asn)/glutamyl-tRNA(Gln) amidotransferase subunit A
MDEFGMGSHSTHSVFGPVAQDSETGDVPADVSSLLSAGGSSGGSAVAVARGEADLALGTDTGGSVRLPAAYCSVVGYKPSYGMISRFGVVPYANSLDTVGFLARDAQRIRNLIVGDGTHPGLWAEHDPRDPTSLSSSARTRCAKDRQGYTNPLNSPPTSLLQNLRIGIPLEYNISELSPSIRNAWARVASVLQDSFSTRIIPVSLPTTRHALAAYYVIAPAEASSNLAKYDGIRYGARAATSSSSESNSDASEGGILYAASRAAGFGTEVKRRILLGAYTLSAKAMDNYFLQAQRVRRLVRRDFDRVFALKNPLVDRSADSDDDDLPVDLSSLDERVPMKDKRGPEEEVDFLLCPTAPTPPPTIGQVLEGCKDPVEEYVNDVFTVPASLAGLPAVSVPVGVAEEDNEKKAAGLQLIGQYGDDARLLGVAEALMEVLRGEGLGR